MAFNNIKCTSAGNHDLNENIYEIRLEWYNKDVDNNDELMWLTLAYNEDSKEWGVAAEDVDCSLEMKKHKLFEYIDPMGCSCIAVNVVNYAEDILPANLEIYAQDIKLLYDEYTKDREGFYKFLTKCIVDNQL